jgi:IclR family transcriptional regulator, KDG regulon repressor
VVRNDGGDVIAAIGVAGPAHRMTMKVLLSCARELMAAADAVSRRLGYQPMQNQKRA